MRAYRTALAFIGLSTQLATAQALQQQTPQAQPPRLVGTPVGNTPNPQQTLDPANNRLDSLLLAWEQKMKGVNSLEAEIVRTETDKIEKTSKVYKGSAKFQRPDRALLNLVNVATPEIYERYLFTGANLYEYRPQIKTVRVHEMGQPGGPPIQDNFLSFLFGMKALDAKQRYDIKLVKEDQWYVYLLVTALSAADKAEFTQARLVLSSQTFLPRQLEFDQPTPVVIKWDIPKIDPAAKVSAADFAPMQVPRDWQIIRVPSQQPVAQPPANPNNAPPPRLVRPAGP